MGHDKIKTVGVLTTSRADYGIYSPVLREVQKQGLKLKLFVSGMHFDPRFGESIKDIEKDGFPIAGKVKVRLIDSDVGIVKAMGEITSGFAEVFSKNKPDILLVLGDRYEMHAGALAAIPLGIPLAHLHGGELTYGVIDEYFRHSLTKLSSLHFVSTTEYARRVVQMGEEPWRVKVSGGPALDNFLDKSFLSPSEIKKFFKIDISKPFLLVTFHPVTKEQEHTKTYTANLLKALTCYSDYNIVFTAPNADRGGDLIRRHILTFLKKSQSYYYVSNFGPSGYKSIMRYAAAMVGNSSSGIIEAASFKLPVVNIGSRQEGRLRAKNVIDVGYSEKDIKKGIDKAISKQFRESLKGLINPYGRGNASNVIVSTLKRMDLNKLKRKGFYTIPYEQKKIF